MTTRRNPPLENADMTFPFALKTLSPEWGLRGIILAGFLAAVMSATSALSNSVATIFSLDVYKKLIQPRPPDRQTHLHRPAGGRRRPVHRRADCPVRRTLRRHFPILPDRRQLSRHAVHLHPLDGHSLAADELPRQLFGLIGGTVIQALVVLAGYLLEIGMASNCTGSTWRPSPKSSPCLASCVVSLVHAGNAGRTNRADGVDACRR